MLHKSLKHCMCIGAIFVGSSLLTTGCIDSDYDLDNVDLTVGLGSEGLSVKMGTTEKIFLKDILDVDETIKLDANNLYYLVKDGTTHYDINIDEVTATLNPINIPTVKRVLSYDDVLNQLDVAPGALSCEVPANFELSGMADGGAYMNLEITGISKDVLQITEAYANDFKISLTMNMETSSGVKFNVHKLKDFEIRIPSLVHVVSVSDGWTLEGNVLKMIGEKPYTGGTICTVEIDRAFLGEYGTPENGSIILGDGIEMMKTSMKGEVFFKSTEKFTMKPDDYADISVSLSHSGLNGVLDVDYIKGYFDPEVNIEDEKIDIAESLPDFLQDEKVRVAAANPTLYFITDMFNIPFGVNFNAIFTSEKSGASGFPKSVEMPVVSLDNNQVNSVYYFQGEKPYDPNPEGILPGSQLCKVENLTSLIEVLPDYINVSFPKDKIGVQHKEYKIKMGHQYDADVNYNVYVPFEFSSGLTIVYRDSTNSVKDDLEDYTAEGVKVSATVENIIPLELIATIKAVDENNVEIPGIHFTEAKIDPSEDGNTAKMTDITIDADLDDPMLLKKIDRLFFHIEATSAETQTNHQLLSTQYLVLKDIKLRLKGQITADLN